jgi:hypothetical protein
MTANAITTYVQGQGSASADNLNALEQTCDNVSFLRGLTGVSGMQITVRGYVTPGDGGAGAFYWSATANGADNGTSIIVPTGSSAGAWVRISADDVNVTIPNTVSASVGVTLTAAQMAGVVITRAGSPSGGFNDTTDTATNIINALPSTGTGYGQELRIVNTSGQTQTLVAGTGVTIVGPATTANGASHIYLIVVSGSAAVTIYG